MHQGITINIGNYQSMHLHSSEHDSVLDIYKDLLHQVVEWESEFDAMMVWKEKLERLIKTWRT